MYCGNCGKELAPNSRFCGHCGTKVPEQKVSTQSALNDSVNQAINSITSAFGDVRTSMTEMVSSIPAPQVPRKASETDWAVTLDIEESCPLIRTNWFATEVTFHIQPDGFIWFDTAPDDLFELIDFAWDGPNIEEKTVHSGNAETKKKGRLKGAVAGGVIAKGIGTVVGGPVGGIAVTAAGAALGAMRGSGDSSSHKESVSKTKTVEHKSVADVTIRSVYSGKIGTFSVKGKSRKFSPLIKLYKYKTG